MDITVSLESGVSVDTGKTILEATFAAQRILEDFLAEDFSDVKVVVAKDHKGMCALIGKDRPKYGVTTNLNDSIYLSDPSSWTETETGHTPQDLTESLVHQMVHLFFRRNAIKAPVWFEEGVAVFVGAHLSDQKREKEFDRLLRMYGFRDLSKHTEPFGKQEAPAYSYLTAYKYVSALNERLGRKKLVRLISSLSTRSNFEAVFKQETGMSVGYSWDWFKQTLNLTAK